MKMTTKINALGIIFFLLILHSFSFGQKGNGIHYSENSYDVQYSQRILSQSYLNEGLNSFGNVNFGTALSYIGLSATGGFKVSDGGFSRVKHVSGQISFSQVIPQKILINDSINGKITGFNFGFSLYGINVFPKIKHFDLLVDFGFNAGRLRLYGNSLIKQKNPYISPALSITPRVRFNKIFVHIRATYDYDISRAKWRPIRFSPEEKVSIENLKTTGLTFFAGIGYIL